MPSHRIVVVGGGLVGLANAWQLLKTYRRRGCEVQLTLLEKESRLAAHQSSHNSGVLHAPLSYRPGSEKALLTGEGLRALVDLCRAHGIAHELCGKLVVATTAAEEARLQSLHDQGIQNGLTGLRILTGSEIREIEPHAFGRAALHVPEEGIVDYPGIAMVLARLITARGGRIVLEAPVSGIVRDGDTWRVESTAGDFPADHVVTCGGLQSDRLAALTGHATDVKIVPFRGEYYRLAPAAERLVRHLIYPVPDPALPFLGVHFTRMIRGGVEAGPNAVLAWHREGYGSGAFRAADATESLLFPGLWRFLAKNALIAAYETYRSASRREFCRSLQRLVPAITTTDLMPGGTGVRAQAMRADGTLVDDFRIVRGAAITHVVNAPSPAATACLAIGRRIAEAVADDMIGAG